MSAPGTIVEIVDSVARGGGVPTDTGVGFAIGFAERGVPGEVYELVDKTRFKPLLGGRVAHSTLSDSVETAFMEGAAKIYVSRLTGPNPVAASINLFDAAGSTAPGDVALVLTAAEVGDWGNGLNAEVTVDGGNFVVIVTHDVDGAIATSPALADRAAAVAWADDVDEFNITLGASNEDPRAMAATALTGGTDDNANVTTDDHEDALEAFDMSYGPGQLAAFGITSPAVHALLKAHGAERNRRPLCDYADTSNYATLEAAGEALQDGTVGRFAASYAPWAIIPGTAPGTTRQVPYSAVQMGLIARSDRVNSPNRPVAGKNGQARWAIGLTQKWTEAERDALNQAGVTVARDINGAIRTYGLRSLADPVTDPDWVQFPGSRLMMAIYAKALAVAEDKQFPEIDGQGHAFDSLQSEIEGKVMLPYYSAGSLYGATAAEAFVVDTGDTVNTPETIAAGQVRVAIGARISPGGELTYITIARQAITQPL